MLSYVIFIVLLLLLYAYYDAEILTVSFNQKILGIYDKDFISLSHWVI